LACLPIIIGLGVFFGCRIYFVKQITTRLRTSAEHADRIGTRAAILSAAKSLAKRENGLLERKAIRARLLATLIYEHAENRITELDRLLAELSGEGNKLPDTRLARAYLALQDENPQAALRLSARTMNTRALAAERAHLRAEALASLGQLKQALNESQAAAHRFPHSPRYQSALALILAKTGNTQQALATLEKVRQWKSLPAVRLAHARILFESGRDPQTAAREANTLLQMQRNEVSNPFVAWSYLLQAQHAAENRDTAAALKNAKAAASIEWHANEAFLLPLIEILSQVGAGTEARVQLEALPPFSALSERRALAEASAWLSLGDDRRAEVAIAKVRTNPKATLLRGRIEHWKGNLAAAHTLFESAVNHPETEVQARVELASVLLAEGDFKGAEQSLERVVTYVQRDLRVVPVAVHVLLAMGKTDQAEVVLNQARTLYEDAPVLLAPSADLALQQRQFQKAYELLKPATVAHSADPTPYRLLGCAALELGRIAEARAAFLQALKLSPRLTPAVLGLAELELNDGNVDAARKMVDGIHVQGAPSIELARLKARLAVLEGAGAQQVSTVSTWATQYSDPQLWASLGNLQFQAEDDDAARRSFGKALRIDAENADALLGEAALAALDSQFEEAHNLTLRAEEVARKQGGLWGFRKARVLVSHGRLLLETGSTKQAAARAKMAIQAEPRLGEAYALAAEIEIQTKKDPKAILLQAVDTLMTPPETWGRLVTFAPEHPRMCEFAQRYLASAPNGYDAAKVKKVMKLRCHR